MRIFILTVVCLALAAPAFAGIYKWKDKNGKIHFTDSLNKVPLDQRSKKRVREIEPAREFRSGGSNHLPTALPPAAQHHIKAKKEGSKNKNSRIGKYKSPTTGDYKMPTTRKYKMPGTRRHKMSGTGKF